jgi:hypothetical protein
MISQRILLDRSLPILKIVTESFFRYKKVPLLRLSLFFFLFHVAHYLYDSV